MDGPVGSYYTKVNSRTNWLWSSLLYNGHSSTHPQFVIVIQISFFSVIWRVECYDLDVVNWRYVVLSRKMVLLYQEEWAKAAINSGETASKATLCIYDIKLK